MSRVLEKAAELASELEVCEELKKVKDMQMIIQGDKEAEKILNEFFTIQQKLYELQEKGIDPSDELNDEFNKVQDEMEKNVNVAKYYQSQAELGQLLQQINSMISEAITGGECTDEMCENCTGC